MPPAALSSLLLLGAMLAGLIRPSCAPARVVTGDAFLCAEARAARAPRGQPAAPVFHPRVGVSAIDRFTLPFASERYTLDLRKAEAYCRPVRLDGEEITDPLSGLEVYESRRTRRKPAPPPLPPATEALESAFGAVTVHVGNVDVLHVPTMAAGSVGGIGPERDDFTCYAVTAERRPGTGRATARTEVRTADGPRTLEVRKLERLCVPASVRGEDPGAPKHPLDLLCYGVRLARDDGNPPAASELVATRNSFGNEVLRVGVPRMLCVPAARANVAVPTPTPFPTLTPPPTPVATGTVVPTPRPATIRVDPPSASGLVRDRSCFVATIELPDGSLADATTTALWRVADGTVAVPSGFVDGKKCFLGVGIGTTEITARDPETGLASPPVRMTADWPIFKMEVNPNRVGMRVGEASTLTTTAFLAGARTRNVTQHVRYESLDESVVTAANATGNRSRIVAVGGGRTHVLVTDALSSIAATVEVATGALSGLTVDQSRALFPGESAQLTVTGIFSAGFVGNLTQDASYESSDPSIVLAPNAPGDRSRVEALRPGVATITATDPLSGIRSTCCGFVSVLGDVLRIDVTPAAVARRLGLDAAPLTFKAVGTYAVPPHDTAARTATDRLIWSSSDESVVAPGDLDAGGGRREFLVVGGGEAVVRATDPDNGVASPPTTVTIYDHLDRLEVGTSPQDPAENDERSILVGQAARYSAYGYFDGQRVRRLDEASLVSSDPAVAEIFDGSAVGQRPGTVTISAVDPVSGLTSNDGGRNAILHVLGTLQRISMSPSAVALDVGQARSLTTFGHYEGGGSGLLTQFVFYESSDPSVVAATNESGNRSRIVAVKAGTATISALDPSSGIKSTDTGDDVVVTVRGEDLVRIVVLPSVLKLPVSAIRRYTAVGHLSNGDTLNLTQRVEWVSTDPAVAFPQNLIGDRSRVDLLAPGTVTISARDPLSGLRSTDTGDDATLTVGVLTGMRLEPSTLELPVGESTYLTTIGTFEGGGTINLTQDAVYTSSDPTVVRAPNLASGRSYIEALKPGTATITAFRASTYPQPQTSEAAIITVVP